MSGANGDHPVTTDFDLLAQEIEDQYDRLVAEREPLKQRLAELDADVRRLERMLHIARPELREAETQPKSGTTKRSPKTRVSQQTMDRVVEFLTSHDPSPYKGFGRDEIAAKLKMSDSAVSYALQQLRAEERVRLVGKRPRTEGQMGQQPLLYAVMSSA